MKRLSTLLILLYFGFSASAQPDTLSQQSQLQDNAYQYPNYLQGVGAGNHGWSRDWWRAKQRIDSLLNAGFSGGGGISPSDTAAMLATYALLSELPAAQSLSFNSSTNVLSISESNGVDLSSLSGGGGGGGYTDTVIISGGSDTITNADEGVLFISLSETEDTLYLAANLSLDSLGEVYFEKHRGGDLIISGGLTNNLNENIATTLTVPSRGGGFIRCLGTIEGAIRFSAIGNYTE